MAGPDDSQDININVDSDISGSLEVAGRDLIKTGDVSGSIAAIGAGAKVIVERALSAVEVAEQAYGVERKRLAEAVVAHIRRLQRRAEQAQEQPELGSPYKALLEYDIDDAALFYGRSAAISAVMSRLERGTLMVLHAESGAGKTSLLKAGIVPRLLAGGDIPLYVRPYQTPGHYAVKRVLLPQMEQAPNLAVASLHDFMQQVGDLLGDQQIVVLLDQFEELFTVQRPEQRADFIAELGPCLEDDLLPVRWVFSLRDEWFGQLGTFRPQIRQPFANEYLLRAFSRTESREIIVEPAGHRGVTYEAGLVERLVDDLGEEEIAPPQLQLVCSTLFDSLDGRTQITQAMYEKAGGTSGILRGHLDRVLRREVPIEQRQAARHLLEALMTSDKRRALRTHDDLAIELRTLGLEQVPIDDVLQTLINSRLLRVEEIEEADQVELAYELAHDYLLEEIELDPATQARKAAQELLDQEVAAYTQHNTLLSADKLAIIEAQAEHLALDADAQNLIGESKNKLTRQRRTIFAGIGVAILLIVLTVALIVATTGAIRAQRTAEKAAQNADARMEVAAIVLAQFFAETGQVQVEGEPVALAWDGNNLWVAVRSSVQEMPDTVYRIDATRGVLTAVIDMPTSPVVNLFWDGRFIWAITTNGEQNYLQQINPDQAEIIASIPVGVAPAALVSDGDDLWVVNQIHQTIEHVDIESGLVVGGGSLGDIPADIVDADGYLWVATQEGLLKAYDPERDEIIDTIALNGRPYALTWDGGDLWVATVPTPGGTGYVQRVDPRTQEVIATIELPTTSVANITALLWDGASIWLTVGDYGNYGFIVQIDPASNKVVAAIQRGSVSVSDLVWDGEYLWLADPRDAAVTRFQLNDFDFIARQVNVGGDIVDIAWDGANLWLADSASHTLRQMKPDTWEEIQSIPFDDPHRIAWGGSDLWATSVVGLGYDQERLYSYPQTGPVQQIDPETGEFLTSIQVGDGVDDMAWADNGLWVTDIADSTLKHIDPQTGQIVKTIPVSDTTGLAWNGESLWVVNNGSYLIDRIDPETGDILGEEIVGGCGLDTLFWDGIRLWEVDRCSQWIQLIDYESFELPRGMGVLSIGEMCLSALTGDSETVWTVSCDGRLWEINVRSLLLSFEALRTP